MAETAPVALIILDGFGYQKNEEYNAISHAKTPHLDQWFKTYPHTLLAASGTAVGLPEGYIGNSEVGHMTIGAGRTIKQTVTRINEAIDDGSFFTNPTLLDCLDRLNTETNRLHIMGLLSDAGVHCLTKHIIAYIEAAHQQGISDIFIHPFLDGRDVPPRSAHRYLEELDAALQRLRVGTIGSVHGRFYAMDRDKNWERTQQSYRTLTEVKDEEELHFGNWRACIDYYYRRGITDEFIPPSLLHSVVIEPGDAIICANFRPDRARQITAAFVESHFKPFQTVCKPSWFFTPISYGTYLPTETLLSEKPIENTFADVLHAHGKRLYSIAETEKYAHITYFFKGGREEPYTNETQVLVPSLEERDYAEHPEMSARIITNRVLGSLTHDPYDVYLINYANSDMVGHSGNFDATAAAIGILDQELAKLYDQIVTKMNGTIYLTADHGKAEEMFDPATNQVKTSHTTNPVPFIVLSKNPPVLPPLKTLANVAPFILSQLHLPIPKSMEKY